MTSGLASRGRLKQGAALKAIKTSHEWLNCPIGSFSEINRTVVVHYSELVVVLSFPNLENACHDQLLGLDD